MGRGTTRYEYSYVGRGRKGGGRKSRFAFPGSYATYSHSYESGCRPPTLSAETDRAFCVSLGRGGPRARDGVAQVQVQVPRITLRSNCRCQTSCQRCMFPFPGPGIMVELLFLFGWFLHSAPPPPSSLLLFSPPFPPLRTRRPTPGYVPSSLVLVCRVCVVCRVGARGGRIQTGRR